MVPGEGLGNLDRVEKERYVAVFCEGDSMPLVIRFRAVAVARMAADIHHRRRATLAVLGDVQVRRDVKFRKALEGDLFDGVTLFIELARDARVERGSLRPGQQAEHVAHLLDPSSLLPFPRRHGQDLLPGAVGDRARLTDEVGGDLLFAFEHTAICRICRLSG